MSHTLLDDFEDGDISEYDGDTAFFSVESADPPGSYQQDNYLDGSSGSSDNMIVEDDVTVSQGETITTHIRAGNKNDFTMGRLTFGNQDASTFGSFSGYTASVRWYNDTLGLQRYDDGSGTTIDSDSSQSIPADEWLELSADWASDGTITVTLNDSSGTQINQVSGSDTNYTAGGYGFYAFSDHPVYFDFCYTGTFNGTRSVGGQATRLDFRSPIAGADRGALQWSDFNPQSQTNIDLSDSENPTLSSGASSGNFTTQEKSQ